MRERLQKFIARGSDVSRRHAEELIVAGKVTVNGDIVSKLGSTIDPVHDQVAIKGHRIEPVTQFHYVAVNKPVGYVCTRAEFPGEKTVYELVPNSRELVIAGRLDKDSDGLVILTNDGELTNKLTHPRYNHEKEYLVTTTKPLTPEAMEKLQSGIRLTEGRAAFDSIVAVTPMKYRVVMHQGWKRQIRRMMSEVHNSVTKLTRVRINQLELGNLPVGKSRLVDRPEIG